MNQAEVEAALRAAFEAKTATVSVDSLKSAAVSDRTGAKIGHTSRVPHRPRRRWSPLVAGVVVVAAATGTLVVTLSSFGQSPRPSAVDTRLYGAYGALVLADGDTVKATGQVLAIPGQPVRFCAPLPMTAVLRTNRNPPVAASCQYGVNATGINLDTLTDRKEVKGVITGAAELSGTYHSGAIAVSDQRAPNPTPPVDIFSAPACAAPPGGWPQGAKDENIDTAAIVAYQTSHPGAILQVAMLRPSATQVVAFALTSGDPAPVRAALAPTYGNRLCVAKSRYTVQQVDGAEASLGIKGPDSVAAGVYEIGSGPSPSGEIQLDVYLTMVTPAIARRSAAAPDGLMQLHPWLTPATDKS